MDRNSIGFRNIDGEVETLATEPDNNYREENSVSSAGKFVDDDVLDLGRKTPDSAKLKARRKTGNLKCKNSISSWKIGQFDIGNGKV